MSKNIRVKPGKAVSAMGFVVGCIFCVIGIVFVIPNFGLFGLLWLCGAAAITIINGMNCFYAEGFSTHEIIVEDDMEDGGNLHNSIEERLELVASLYREGKITKEEYDRKRQSILDEI